VVRVGDSFQVAGPHGKVTIRCMRTTS
jgi:hypothetical protein